MNTTEIGDKFENRSLEILQRIIAEEQLGFTSRFLKIKTKAPYYSHLRKKNIIFDLAVELWPPGAERYALIYLIECKHYGRRVSVDKLNDFIYRVNEIAPVNGKAIFITNSPLQQAAFNVAESTGMMVVHGESAENYKIILHKTNRNLSENSIPIIPETYHPELIDEGVKLLAQQIDGQILSVLYQDLNESRVGYGIDRLSKIQIEQIAYKELNKMNPRILESAFHISPKSLKEFLNKRYGISIVDDIPQENILGACDLENNTISLKTSVVGSPRELFILAHEFGHYILHQKLSIGQKTYDNFADAEYDFRKGKYELTNPRNWIEWQANYFASCFVLPNIPFYFKLGKVQQSLNMSQGKIYLDDQTQNRNNFYELVGKLAHRFSVTKTSIIYKLKELNLINDHSRVKTIGQLIAEYEEDLFT